MVLDNATDQPRAMRRSAASIAASHARRIARSLAVVSAAAVAVPAQAAYRYDGVAYDRDGRVAYRETHWRYSDGHSGQRLVLYRCADGRPFARKVMRWLQHTEASPDFEFLDQRDGYREGVVSRAEGREVFWQASSTADERRERVWLGSDAVVDAGFDSFVRRHWEALIAGTPVKAAFLIPADFNAIPVVIRLAGGPKDDPGRPTVTFAIELDRWYAFAVPSMSVTYDRHDRSLRVFEGAVTVRDDRGKRQWARVEFPVDARAPAVARGEIAAATAEPLVPRCGEG